MRSTLEKNAAVIVKSLGGRANIKECFRCISHLRFLVKDPKRVSLKKLAKVTEVESANLQDLQVKIGIKGHLGEYYQAVMGIVNLGKDFSRIEKGELRMAGSSAKDAVLAKDIVNLVGGKDNVISLIHCVTRLRFKLKDESKADDDKIKHLKGVMGVAHAGGQYQVIIGSNVADIYDEAMPILGLSTESETAAADDNKNVFSKIVSFISSLFMPLLGVMTGAGMMKGLLVLLTTLGWVKSGSGTYMIWNAAGDAMFYFLPILLGFTAAKALHVNQFLGATIGAALVYPDMIAAYTAGKSLTFMGVHVVLMKYAQTMLPVIFAVWGVSLLEKFTKKVIPKTVQNLFVPLLDLMVVVPLSYLIIGPVFQTISQWIANASMWIYGLAPIVAGLVLGAIWQGVVILGLHWAFIPILMNNLTTNGFDPINGIFYGTLFGQVGACLAMGLKAKDTEFKEIALPAALSGFFGITEPIIYGVTLPHKKAFACASAGSAVGGAIAAAFHAGMYTMPGGGIFGIPCFINPKTGVDASFIAFVVAQIVSFALAFVLTMIFGDVVVPTEENHDAVKAQEFKDEAVVSPLQGTVVALEKVNDPVFSQGTIGKGVAIQPTSKEIRAPFDGKVVSVFPTKHAIGLQSNNGVELLIHLGIDTVQLQGEGFDVKVSEGQNVKAGDLLESYDYEAIAKKGYDVVVPVIVTNSNNFDDIVVNKADGAEVKFGDQLLTALVDQVAADTTVAPA